MEFKYCSICKSVNVFIKDNCSICGNTGCSK